MNDDCLSLELTLELSAILESKDWDAFDDFLARNGWDENTQWITEYDESHCADCGEANIPWAEEAPNFRLCYGCVEIRINKEQEA